jgi:predicted dehydrogenase
MRKLKVGLIGLGVVSQAHLEAYRDLEPIEVVAGSDLDEEKLLQMSSKWGIRAYLNFEEMLEKENLDIACVLTPPSSHREITEKVAEHKVNILCEKPMTLAIEDAKSMIRKCKKEGVKFFYGSCYRFLSPCRKAKEMVEQGELGDISLLVEIYIGGQGLKNYKDPGPPYFPEEGPGGAGMGLIDHGIHLVDIFRWITGSEVESVYGRGNYSGKAPHSEYLTMNFASGATGQLLYDNATYASDLPNEGIFSWGGCWDIDANLVLDGGWDSHPGNFRIHGTKGALRVFHYAHKLFFFGEGGGKQIPVTGRPMPANFTQQMESYAQSIIKDEEPEVSGEDGLKALQIVLAAYDSFKAKKSIEI